MVTEQINLFMEMMESAASFSYKVMMPAAGCAVFMLGALYGVSLICDFSQMEQLGAWDTNYEL